jgi:hypothetical protein
LRLKFMPFRIGPFVVSRARLRLADSRKQHCHSGQDQFAGEEARRNSHQDGTSVAQSVAGERLICW